MLNVIQIYISRRTYVITHRSAVSHLLPATLVLLLILQTPRDGTFHFTTDSYNNARYRPKYDSVALCRGF